MFNLTETIPFSYNGSTSYVELELTKVISTLVKDINNGVIMCIFFIFFGYFMQKIFLPRVILGLNELKNSFQDKNIIKVFDGVLFWLERGISLSETFILGGVVFLFAIAYIQDVIPFYVKYPLIIMGIFVSLIVIAEIIGFFVKKKYKKIIPSIKTLYKKMQKWEKKKGFDIDEV